MTRRGEGPGRRDRITQSSSLRGAVEALLFVSDEPVSAARIAKVLDAERVGRGAPCWASLAEEYQAGERGFQLREVAGGWRFFTHPAYHDQIESFVLSWDTRRLSQAALEALAVIAYHQPVTRAGVNAVRGVNSEAVIASLVEKGLIREIGRDKDQANAIVYGDHEGVPREVRLEGPHRAAAARGVRAGRRRPSTRSATGCPRSKDPRSAEATTTTSPRSTRPE